VSDRTSASRSTGSSPRRRLTNDIRLVIAIACVVTVLCILIGGHLYGRYLSARDLGGRDNAIEQLRAQDQSTKRQLDAMSARATELDAQLRKVQATLNAIMPVANTYNIEPNQSLIVGSGHLTVGLVGSPGNERVTLNINGKDQSVAAGQVVNVTPDPSTNCQVQVQSFDMFKAVLVASCASAKPQ